LPGVFSREEALGAEGPAVAGSSTPTGPRPTATGGSAGAGAVVATELCRLGTLAAGAEAPQPAARVAAIRTAAAAPAAQLKRRDRYIRGLSGPRRARAAICAR